MYYKFAFTGTEEVWGYGIPVNNHIVPISNNVFALRPGSDLSTVENSTVEITALTDDEVVLVRDKYDLPEDLGLVPFDKLDL